MRCAKNSSVSRRNNAFTIVKVAGACRIGFTIYVSHSPWTKVPFRSQTRTWDPNVVPALGFFFTGFRAVCERRKLTARSTSCFLANFLAEGFFPGVGRGIFDMARLCAIRA
jgi:hypothetical protein